MDSFYVAPQSLFRASHLFTVQYPQWYQVFSAIRNSGYFVILNVQHFHQSHFNTCYIFGSHIRGKVCRIFDKSAVLTATGNINWEEELSRGFVNGNY